MTWIRICIVGHLLDLRTQEANYSFRPILRSLDPSPQYNLCGSSSMIKKLNFCPSVKFFLPIFMKIQIQVAENRIQFGSRSTGRPQVYRNWFEWLVVCVFAGKCTPPPSPPPVNLSVSLSPTIPDFWLDKKIRQNPDAWESGFCTTFRFVVGCHNFLKLRHKT